MSIQEIDFSKTLSDDQVYETIMANYSNLSREWIFHQWNWMNNVYSSFKDHYKYMIIISLVEKTLQFYDQMQIKYSYEEYYSKSYQQIEKFSITELCEKLDLPKETVRRKVLELEKDGVITRDKKKIIIDRKAFPFVKPENQIKFSAKYIYLVSCALNKNKIYSKKLDSKTIENMIKKNFSLCWRWFYRMQIPLIIGYHKFMKEDGYQNPFKTTEEIKKELIMRNSVTSKSKRGKIHRNHNPNRLNHLQTKRTILVEVVTDPKTGRIIDRKGISIDALERSTLWEEDLPFPRETCKRLAKLMRNQFKDGWYCELRISKTGKPSFKWVPDKHKIYSYEYRSSD